MAFTPFYDGLQSILETYFRAATQPDSTKFRVALCGTGSYNAGMALTSVLALELLTSDGYSRESYSPIASVKDTSGKRLYFPTFKATFENTGGSALSYDCAILLADGDAVANKPVAAIGGSDITIPSHGRASGDRVCFTGTIPTGLEANRIYYVLSTGLATNSFQVATSPGGGALSIGSLAGDLICRFANGAAVAYQVNDPDGTGSISRSINPGSTHAIEVNLSLRGA